MQSTENSAQHSDKGADANDSNSAQETEEKSNKNDELGDFSDNDRITTLEAQLKDQSNRYLYLYAEFDNFKKRTLKERAELLKYGHESLSKELLVVADNLERALQHTSNEQKSSVVFEGIQMISKQLAETLNKFGITTIKTEGEKFSPEFHEAVGVEDSHAKSILSGHIVREVQKGYLIHGRLLRAAKVIIAK